MRDTATLLELLEAEEGFWGRALTAEPPAGMDPKEERSFEEARKRYRNHRWRLAETINFYREEASRGTT